MKIDQKRSKKFKKAYNINFRKKIALKISFGLLIIIGMVFTPQTICNNSEQKEDFFVKHTEYTVASAYTSQAARTSNELLSDITPNEKMPIVVEEVEKIGTIALSFDDGPSKKITPEILKVLDKNKVSATFFVSGINVNNNKELIFQIYESGHEIGNHGYDHTSFTSLSKNDIQKQIQTTNDYLFAITGAEPALVRPPYGAINNNVALSIDKPIVLWSIDPTDWKDIPVNIIVNNILTNLKDGKIILLHDIHERTIEVTKIIIPKIKELGYDIVTVEQLFKLEEINLESGKIYSKVKK